MSSVVAHSADVSIAPADAARRPRLWPPVLIVAAYAIAYVGLGLIDVGAYGAFFGRMIALGLLTLLYSVWWLFSRRLPLRDRLGVFIAAAITLALAMALVHPSAKGLQLVMLFWALPAMFAAWTVWLLVTRHSSRQVTRLGMIVLAALALWPMVTVRLDGLSGAAGAVYHWRWTPTGEELFLADRAAHRKPAADDAAAADAAAGDAVAQPLAAGDGDWPEFRGSQRNGAVHGVKIRTDWDAAPPKLLWRHRVGPGWSSIVVIGNRLFTQEQREDKEAVLCYDADTGEELWVHEDEARFSEGMGGVGPRATPTFVDGRIYALGALGQLNCLDAATGDVVWSRDIKVDGQGSAPYWGFSSSPLVVDGKVIVFAGGGGTMSHGSGNNPEDGNSEGGDAEPAADGAEQAASQPKNANPLLAYDAATGELAWKAPSGDHSYSSPQAATFDGVTQVLFLSDAGLVGVDPADGKKLWELPANAKIGQSSPSLQPLLQGDSDVLASFQTDAGVVRATIKHVDDRWEVRAAEAPWPNRQIRPFFNDFVSVGPDLYGFDGKIFSSFNAAAGKPNWKKGRYGSGQVLLIADQPVLLVISESGEAVLVAASPDKHEELGRFQAIEGKTWNHPTVAHGRLYVRNAEEMACYEL